MKRLVVFVLCIPANLAGWLVLGALLLARAGRRVTSREPEEAYRLIVEGVPDGVLARRWRYSTTFGPHAVLLYPGSDEITMLHELKHTSQAEGVAIGWWLAALASWDLRMVWLSVASWAFFYAGASFAAVLADKPWYTGNEYEMQAYALQYAAEAAQGGKRTIVTPPPAGQGG